MVVTDKFTSKKEQPNPFDDLMDFCMVSSYRVQQF